MSDDSRTTHRRLSGTDLETLNRQIALAANAGTPLVPALRSLRADLASGQLRDAVDVLARDLEGGASLSDAFARQPDRFPPLYVSMLRAAEASGNLRGVMDVLSHLVTQAAALRRKIAVAAIYPLIVLALTLGILAFLMVYVVPVIGEITGGFGSIYRSFGTAARPSPVGNVMVMETLAGIVVAVAVVGFAVFIGIALAPGAAGGILRRIPFIGPVLRAQGYFVFCKTFAALLRAGVPMREALAVVREVVPDAPTRHGVDHATNAIASGSTFGAAIYEGAVAGHFPQSLAWLAQTAESRGDLPAGLDEAGRYFADEADRRSLFLMEILPPVMVIGTGGMIVMLVLPLLLSLLAMMRMLGGAAGGY